MADIPFDDRDGFIWMDGEMLPWREAKVHYLTHGLHYGTLVFEGERAYSGKIFKSVQHSERLIKSAELIYMDVEQSIDEIEEIKKEVLKKNGLENAYIRAAAWRGSEKMGNDPEGTKTHFGIAAWDWGTYFDPAGVTLGRSRWNKPMPTSAPVHSKCSCLYNLSCMAKHEAKKAGFTDALMLDYEGYVAESTVSNLFFIKDGALFTPTADRFLNGLTRQTVIDLAKGRGIEVVEKRIKPEELNGFEEVFLTGTAAEVTPISKIDDHEYGVGDMTRQLSADYRALVNG